MATDFQNTLAAAGNVQAPASPLGNFPELANFYKQSFQAPVQAAGANAFFANNATSVANQNAASSYARSLATSALADKINKIDPTNEKNYQKIPNDKGGYNFKDPSGNPISVQDYAHVQTQLTGKQIYPADVLSDSKNSLDQQYVQDHTNLEKLINYSTNGDTTNRDKLATQIGGPAFLKILKSKNVTPYDLINQFMAYYPHVYGGQNLRDTQAQLDQLAAASQPR